MMGGENDYQRLPSLHNVDNHENMSGSFTYLSLVSNFNFDLLKPRETISMELTKVFRKSGFSFLVRLIEVQ